MDFKKMELSELASLVKVSLKEPGIGKFIIESKLAFSNRVPVSRMINTNGVN